ncbi:MAG: prolipoprotein diacylglyceryl transferase [Acidiferrobacterales bacterium]|nr:prolipoprotein diacylglyceryl transferase [Acidiferrobacterales bacterium]
MLIHPNFDPVAVQLGPFAVHWYGLMYVLGFLGVYLYGSYRINRYSRLSTTGWTKDLLSDLIFYGALGAVIGGRLGYVMFYKPLEYLSNPVDILMINQGGMSFHGGLLGVIAAMAWFAKVKKFHIYEIGDFVAPLAPIGLFFGRLGNFINQELWGKVTDLPWGMVFTNGGSEPRHPSMLYEAVLEGLVLLFLISWLARKPRPLGMLAGLFLVGYAIARILVEFVRVPDEHLNYLLLDWVTMGHLLCLPMLVFGLYLMLRRV